MKESKSEKLLKSFIPMQQSIQLLLSQMKKTEALGPYLKDGATDDKITALKAKYDSAIDKYVSQSIVVEKMIEQIEDFNQQTVLRLRYIEGLKWHDISMRMHYSQDHCIRLRKAALEELDTLI